MRREATATSLRLLFALALLAAIASGCGASRLLHRGGASTLAVPPSGEAPTQKSGKSRADKDAFAAFAGDPLAEAHARAQQSPDEPYWPYRAATLEADAGHTAAAETDLRAALARDSSYAPALTQMSRLLYVQGRHDEAVRLLEPVRQKTGALDAADRSAVLAGLALHEAALGRDDEARAVVALMAHGDREDAAGVAAYLAVRGSSTDSAAKLTEAAVKAAPESAANHNNRGIALLRSGDPDAAAREFEHAIALDPKLPGPWYNMAILERWYRLDHATAVNRFQQYWTRSHADPDSLYGELGRGGSVPVAEEAHK